MSPGDRCVSRSLPMLEWEAVLKRREILQAARGTVEDMEVILDRLAAVCLPVDLHFLWRAHTRDPDDDMVIETALNGRADTVATFNVRHLGPAAAGFGITVGHPSAILRRLG